MCWWLAETSRTCVLRNFERPSAAWLVRTPKSVRPQRARCAVCVFVDGNSHSEAEVSKILDWVQSERASSHRRSSPTGAVGAVLSPKRKPTQISRRSSHKKQQEQIHHRREGNTHEPTESPTP